MKRKRGSGSYVNKQFKPPKKKITRGATTFVVARTPGVKGVTETKYFDFEKAATAITAPTTDWTGTEMDPTTMNCLFAPTQGNNYNNREGRRVTIKKLRMNCFINSATQADQTTLDAPNYIRVILYLDKQTNAAQAQGEDLMASGPTGALPFAMFQNPANFGRFKVLKEKRFTMQNPNFVWDGTNIEQNGLIKMFKLKYAWKKGLTINFNNTNGGTVADIVDNSLHVIAITNNIGFGASLGYKGRITFCE